MKFTLTLCLSLFCGACVSAEGEEAKITEAQLRALEGTYTFNPTDTDEMAYVRVKFRRAIEGKEVGDWVADGTMDNSFHGTVVTFKGAYVYRENEGGVVVSAQFFGFTLSAGSLDWNENYKRSLSLEKKPPAAEDGAADKPKSGE